MAASSRDVAPGRTHRAETTEGQPGSKIAPEPASANHFGGKYGRPRNSQGRSEEPAVSPMNQSIDVSSPSDFGVSSPHAAISSLATARCAWCGAAITLQRRGRRRVTCSERCRHRRETIRRQMTRRVRWIREWLAQADAGFITAEDAAHEVAALREDLAELTTVLEQGQTR